MNEVQPGLVTQMLEAASAGDRKAADELLPLVYAELKRLARVRLAKTPPGNTLQPTALVHEAYLRLVGDQARGWDSRGHFFAAAAQSMRQILVEQARHKATIKAGGGRRRIALDDAEPSVEPKAVDLLALDEALNRLTEMDPRKAKIVMLRYFAGLTNEEIASALGISVPTVEREWRFSRVFLFSQLGDATEDS